MVSVNHFVFMPLLYVYFVKLFANKKLNNKYMYNTSIHNQVFIASLSKYTIYIYMYISNYRNFNFSVHFKSTVFQVGGKKTKPSDLNEIVSKLKQHLEICYKEDFLFYAVIIETIKM